VQETSINDTGGWVKAATGKIENPEFSKQIFTDISKESSYGGCAWLAIANEVDSMKIQKKIIHLKTKVHLLYEAYDKINLSIT